MSSWPAPTQAPRWTPSGVPASRNVQLRRWPRVMSKERGLDVSRSSGNPNFGAVQLHRHRPVEDPVQAVRQAGAACPDDDDPRSARSRGRARRGAGVAGRGAGSTRHPPGRWTGSGCCVEAPRPWPPHRSDRRVHRRAAAEITGREKARVAGAWVDPRPRFAARGTPRHRATIRTSTQRSRSPGASSDVRALASLLTFTNKGAWA